MRGPRLLPLCGPVDQIMTSCSGPATGKRRSINWSIRVKMAVLAPMPRESEATATRVKSGLRRRLRRANRRSKRNLAMAYKVSTPQARKSLQELAEILPAHLPAGEIADGKILKPHIAFAAGVQLEGDAAIERLGLGVGEIDHGDAVEDADHVIAFHRSEEHTSELQSPMYLVC